MSLEEQRNKLRERARCIANGTKSEPGPARMLVPPSEREMEYKQGLWLTPKDLGKLLQINERTVVRYLERGKLPGMKIGTKWRIPRCKIDAMQT